MSPLTRLRQHRDVVICLVLVTFISCVYLARMGLLSPSASQQDVLVVDAARTAYVAKNLIEGKGYTTDDLPASIVAFYDREGRLHDEHWLNADRFPFAAFATAALYAVTGQRDAWTGVILYNLIVFVLFLTALYLFAKRITGSPLGGALTCAVAMLHGHTYVFLYMKDADMLLLAVLTISAFHRYFSRPLAERGSWEMVWMGTVLAWSFLARPNVGMPFLVAFAGVSLVGLWRAIRTGGVASALVQWLRRDGLGGAVAALWLLPFLIHTIVAWHQPFFSVNALYQPALGTRFGMGTDTWWRYFPPGFDPSIGHLWQVARGEVIAKLTTSWFATFRTFVSAYFLELVLAIAALQLAASRRAAAAGVESTRRPLRATLWIVAAGFVFNYLLLPIYSYKDYSWRHYLAFALPGLWLGAGIGLLHAKDWLAPWASTLPSWLKKRGPLLAVLGFALVVAVAMRGVDTDGNLLIVATTKFWNKRWLVATIVLIAIALIPRWRRWPRQVAYLALATGLLIAVNKPSRAHKNFTHIHVPVGGQVWQELRQRRGLVSSFALQTQVSWNTGRKNIPAPEWVMNLYAMSRTHHLDFEDLYIESPKAQLKPFDGLFGRAAPGFEGYERLATYRDHLPGYRLTFHEETNVGRPRWRVGARDKSSTIYTRGDQAAFDAIFATPQAISLGDPANVVHTAHGFGGYYTIDGKPTVVATNRTRLSFAGVSMDRPFEDTSITFFVDERVPTRVTLEVYALARGTSTFYWNLDLDEYTPAAARKQHLLGELRVDKPGWQTVTFEVPSSLPRRGLNKIGFRAGAFVKAALCDDQDSEVLCAAAPIWDLPQVVFRAETDEKMVRAEVSMFLHRIEFATGS